MKKFKRIVALLLAGVLALSMLTGCGAGFYSEEGEALVKGTLEALSEELDGEELENDMLLALKLRSMLSKIDKDGMIKDTDASKVAGEMNGKPYATLEMCRVLTMNDNISPMALAENTGELLQARSDVTSDGLVYFAGSMLYRILSEGMDLTGIAVAYRVVDGKMYVAVAVTGEYERSSSTAPTTPF